MMRNRIVRFVSLLVVLIFASGNSICFFAAASTAETELSTIFGGKEPNIKLAGEKLNSLVTYTTKRFKDIKAADWYTSNLSKLVGLRGIDGYSDGTFKPKNSIKTAEFIKLLLAAAGYKQELHKDVWYKNYVDKAKELGVIEDGDGYNYDGSMARMDMAKMILRLLKLDPKAASTPVFTDVAGIDTKWIDTAFSEYLIRGYYSKKLRTFKPTQTATRAEVTEMIVRVLEFRDDPNEYRIKMKAYYKEIERQQDLADGTYVMPPLAAEQRARLNGYPENQKVDTSVMKGHYMSNKDVVKAFTKEYLMDLIRKAKGYIEAFNNVDYRIVDLTFKNEVKKYLASGYEYIGKSGEKIIPETELDKFVKTATEDKAVVVGRYITDTSMIYICDDGRVRIKGVLLWCIKENNRPNKLSVNVGKWYEDDVEIELAKWNRSEQEMFSKIVNLKINQLTNNKIEEEL
ncbi:MAG TPA: S-layer homology domain-containing protein [Pseudobacteroides sp.]|uniref:S-layer homology domain-containing protein n=1 Tax=Pseudobacteroides sp. TaxID=1968840 RepID=UPI002F9381A0